MHNSYLAIVNVATSVVSAVINNLSMFLDDITNKCAKIYIYIVVFQSQEISIKKIR